METGITRALLSNKSMWRDKSYCIIEQSSNKDCQGKEWDLVKQKGLIEEKKTSFLLVYSPLRHIESIHIPAYNFEDKRFPILI